MAQQGVMPIMAGPPSIRSNYISVMSEAIEKAENDPAQLRSLVYNIARSSLCKHVLTNYRELGNARWSAHFLDLEEAIKQVESRSQSREPFSDATDNGTRRNNPPIMLQRASEFYPVDKQFREIIQPSEIWTPAFGGRRKHDRINVSWRLEWAIVALIGVVICAVLLAALSYIQMLNHSTAGQLAQGGAPSIPANAPVGTKVSLREANPASAAKELGFSPPTVYGVYAVSAEKLFALDPLPIKVPDSRVGISAIISEPSHVMVPNGKLAFVIYRRDLASSAPVEVFVRVVAQVEREMKFNVAGPPTPEKINGQWAIRSKSYEFNVTPMDGNPEMVVLRPKDPNLVLSAGRYALAIAENGYDFTVAGQMTDTAECLERTDVVGGTVYSECRTLPPLAN